MLACYHNSKKSILISFRRLIWVISVYNCACTYAQFGRKKEAMEYLQKAIGNEFKNIIEWIENDPDFKAFRDDPQFREILAKAGE